MRNKKTYQKPNVEKIKVDKNISMVMQSLPPGDPGAKLMSPLK